MGVGASLVDVEFSPLTKAFSLLEAGVLIFFSAVFGLSFSQRLGFEPFRLRQGIRDRGAGRALGQIMVWMLVLIVLNVVIQVLILPGLVKLGIAQPETPVQALEPLKESSLPQIFFCMLGGAGIQEEVIFRLLCMTGIWLAAGRADLAIVVSAVIFGAYHLSPLDALYLEFWNYPLYQFSYTLLAGLVFAWVYRKGGIEATILGHTLWNFVGIVFFVK
jgi:membrane protease YdiL (CAAX protease family)